MRFIDSLLTCLSRSIANSKFHVTIFCTFLMTAGCVVGQAQAQTVPVAIRGARVIDGTGAPAKVETVLIRDGRIVAVGNSIDIPTGTKVIYATGATLLPGLFDLHTHLQSSGIPDVAGDWAKNLKSYLACGVTSINDYSENGEQLAPLRKLQSSGIFIGPRIHYAVRLGTTNGHGTEFGWGDFMTLHANSPAEAHAAMKVALSYKPDVIKVFTDGWRYNKGPNLTSMNLQTLTAIVNDAHKAGVRVFTHTVTLAGAKIAAHAGVDVLAHGVGDAPVDEELISLLKKHGTSYVSTLAVFEPSKTNVPSRMLASLLPQIGELTLKEGTEDRRENDTAINQRWKYLQENVRRLYKAGVPIATGTDAGVTGTFHGWATLHEIELLVDSGLTPLQALTAATEVSARAVGDEKERGTIEPGKIADLLLVDGSPDKDIHDIERTHAVFLKGRELDLSALKAAIKLSGMTPLPTVTASSVIDDFEQMDGRSSLDTLRMDATDEGIDHSKIFSSVIARQGGGYALMVLSRMAPKEHPYVRLEIPLTPGAVMPADISRFHGIRFDARGDGGYRLILHDYGELHEEFPSAEFHAGTSWKTIRIPFADIRQANVGQVWNLHGVQGVQFELSRPAGMKPWLELDNVKFY